LKANWITNQDGSIYHLHLLPEQIASLIITVGDPSRVSMISNLLDTIECKISSREFVCHTGRLGNKRMSIISTGIGTDNIDIVLNEIDALFNIDLKTGLPKETPKSCTIIRLGTSGAIQEDVPMNTLLLTEWSIGTDALMNYYQHEEYEVLEEVRSSFKAVGLESLNFHLSCCDSTLINYFKGSDFQVGNTLTAPGFYGPQGRTTRIKNSVPDLIHKLQNIHFKSIGRLTNIEMETSGIYHLGKALGHKCLSVNAILANRLHNTFSEHPEKIILRMIEKSLGILENLP
jgi:uridine phosphorylase